MSRSRKRSPVCAMSGAESERAFKRMEHQRERAAVRDALRTERDPPSPRRYGNPALAPKDGKSWAPGLRKVLRK